MLYLIAILCPPLAVLCCGRFLAALLNLFLSILYVPGLIHALMVVSEYKADRRTDQLVRAVGQSPR